jgi:hypothetical protein
MRPLRGINQAVVADDCEVPVVLRMLLDVVEDQGLDTLGLYKMGAFLRTHARYLYQNLAVAMPLRLPPQQLPAAML